jgi:hypothetical protein
MEKNTRFDKGEYHGQFFTVFYHHGIHIFHRVFTRREKAFGYFKKTLTAITIIEKTSWDNLEVRKNITPQKGVL